MCRVSLLCKDVFILFLLVVDFAMAYSVSLTNFLVTKHIIVLTLQVLGNAKGDIAMVVSVIKMVVIVSQSLVLFFIVK
jgi:hypothetical protein